MGGSISLVGYGVGPRLFAIELRVNVTPSHSQMEISMTRLMLAALLATFAIGSAQAQGTCESRAVGQDGRPLTGAAKNSFLAKCKREACTPKAVGADGKPLKGAAKNSFMAKCQRET